MKTFNFITHNCRLVIHADDSDQAWDIFENTGFLRSECLAVR